MVRAADMAVDKQESLFAAPPHPRELAAIGQSWDNSFCHDADTGSQNVATIAIADRDRPRQAAPALEPGACLSWYLAA